MCPSANTAAEAESLAQRLSVLSSVRSWRNAAKERTASSVASPAGAADAAFLIQLAATDAASARTVRVCYAAASLAGADPAPPGAPAGAAGATKPNQDAWLTSERPGGGDALLLAVFDGHGHDGGGVSRLLASRLAPLAAAAGLGRADAGAAAGGVAKPAPRVAWPPATGRRASSAAGADRAGSPRGDAHKPLVSPDTTALDAALARAHAAVVASPTIDAALSGSTAVAVALGPRGVALAHVGDSRALLGEVVPAPSDGDGDGGDDGAAPPSLVVTALTADHTPARADEAARVLASRGRIGAYTHLGRPVGPLRVWLPTVDAPGLCMTRAIGDTVAAGAGVIPRAETAHAPLPPAARYLVLVSDGVTEFESDANILATVDAVARAGGGPADAARALVARARRQWVLEEGGSSDDCTAVVAFLETVIDGRDGGRGAAAA